MSFWENTWSNALGSLIAVAIATSAYFLIQWFLAATDIEVGYSWQWRGDVQDPTSIYPSFDVRNYSRSRTYYLGNIAYFEEGRPIASFDNNALWGVELKPGTITHRDGARVISNLPLWHVMMHAQVEVRQQNGRTFWLTASGPGSPKRTQLQTFLVKLRASLDAYAIPME